MSTQTKKPGESFGISHNRLTNEPRSIGKRVIAALVNNPRPTQGLASESAHEDRWMANSGIAGPSEQVVVDEPTNPIVQETPSANNVVQLYKGPEDVDPEVLRALSGRYSDANEPIDPPLVADNPFIHENRPQA